MRIAFFTDSLPPITDGVAHTLGKLAATLTADGIDFRFVSGAAPSPDCAWRDKVIGTRSVPFLLYDYYRVSLPYMQGVAAELDEFRPDLVHVVSPTPLGIWGQDYADKRGLPTVGSYHTHFVSYFPYYGFGAFEPVGWAFLAWFYGRCQVTYPPSEAAARELRAHGLDRVELWQRGINLERFSPSHRDPAFRRSLGLGEDEKLLLFVGRLVKEKDIDVVLDAAERLDAEGRKFRLAFVGDGPMAPEIRTRRPDALLPGFQRGADLGRWFASSDVFAFPSTTETFGNVVLEAGASGLPVVCCRAGGPADLVEAGVNGSLVEPGDVDGFAGELGRLMDDAGLAHAQGEAGRRRAERYDWTNVNRGLVNSYRRVLDTWQPSERRSLVRVPKPLVRIAERTPAAEPRPARRVVVVLADGLRPDAIRPHTMPSLFSIGQDHVRYLNASTVTPSVTIAALTSLGTGVRPDEHGLTTPGVGIIPRIPSLDPLSSVLRREGMRTTVFGSAIPFRQATLARLLTGVVGIHLVLKGSRAREVAAAAADQLRGLGDGLVFVYLSDCDVAGHAYGWMSDEYIRAAEEVDVAIARLVPRASEDLFIVLADHGGGGVDPRDHDAPHPTNSHIPLIVAGPDTRREAVVGDPVRLIDVPPTILWHLGIDVPASYDGRVLTSAFATSRMRERA